MIKAVVFDFDGTLTPLTLNFTRIKSEILKIAERYVPSEVIVELGGEYIIETIYSISERLEEPFNHIFKEEAFDRLNFIEMEAGRGKDLFFYAREVLSGLKRRGIRLCIITRTSRDVLRLVFPDMDRYIDCSVTRDDTRYVKPDPKHPKVALEKVMVLPEEAIMVGDHPTDIIGGKTAGMLTVGVLTGRTERRGFEEVGADFIIPDIRGLIEMKEIFQGV
ncbi:MAG: HAD family hydrolase [Syntrophorhabdaceae bacterium]|nr:HAD family hydrolase [Syntrophorhabdaceae bacterium]